MPDFVPTHYIMLFGTTVADGTLSWGVKNPPNLASGAKVADVGNDGVLTQGSDTFSLNSSKFSGFYVSVGGQNYGIFLSSGGIYSVPYDSAVSDLSSVPNAGQTSLFTTSLENAANCFLTGTQIATPDGERPIETLQPDDLVLTAEGTATPVLWVWQQEITNIFGLGEARAPIRVAAHALGPGCPSRDLIVTADHALVVDGLLINAGALVNGTTIRAEPLSRMPANFTYWHIETEEHSVLLAENCPAESFVDYTPRDAFDNHAAYLERYGEGRIIQEMPLIRISTPRLLPPSVKTRLLPARAS